jgi:hypothetical protein
MQRNADQLRANRDNSNPSEPTRDQSPAKEQLGEEEAAHDEAEFAEAADGTMEYLISQREIAEPIRSTNSPLCCDLHELKLAE